MRRSARVWLLTALVLTGLPAAVRAQQMALPNFGPMVGAGGQPISGKPATGDPGLSVTDTFVAWVESAVPRSTVGMRFDGAYYDRQPMRAAYLYSKGGVLGGSGFPLPETRVDSLELTSFGEYSLTPWLSFFMEAPYRWVNPEVNENTSGAGDMRYGLKICTWSDDNVIATILLRFYQPSARQSTLGSAHWSFEPGLLAAYKISPMITFEGEFRYWIPITSDDFAGKILRYGAGFSYGQRKPGFWVNPVVEGIGWSILSGQSMIAPTADGFTVPEARNHTIFNGYFGLRMGYGKSVDWYIGYGRAITGDFWARDNYRFELRYSF